MPGNFEISEIIKKRVDEFTNLYENRDTLYNMSKKAVDVVYSGLGIVTPWVGPIIAHHDQAGLIKRSMCPVLPIPGVHMPSSIGFGKSVFPGFPVEDVFSKSSPIFDYDETVDFYSNYSISFGRQTGKTNLRNNMFRNAFEIHRRKSSHCNIEVVELNSDIKIKPHKYFYVNMFNRKYFKIKSIIIKDDFA